MSPYRCGAFGRGPGPGAKSIFGCGISKGLERPGRRCPSLITVDKVLADLEHDKLLAREHHQYSVASAENNSAFIQFFFPLFLTTVTKSLPSNTVPLMRTHWVTGTW